MWGVITKREVMMSVAFKVARIPVKVKEILKQHVAQSYINFAWVELSISSMDSV